MKRRDFFTKAGVVTATALAMPNVINAMPIKEDLTAMNGQVVGF